MPGVPAGAAEAAGAGLLAGEEAGGAAVPQLPGV